MHALGNILWHFPFFGFLSAFITFLGGLLLTVTVIAAPIGHGLIQYSKFLLSPFSHEMINEKALDIKHNELWSTYSTIVMLVWIPFGAIYAFIIVIQLFFLFITIIGIPVAIVLAKSLPTIFNPVGKVCVSRAVSEEIERRKAQKEVDIALSKNKVAEEE